MKEKLSQIYKKKKIFSISKVENNLIFNFLKVKEDDDFYKKKIFYKNYLNWLSKTLKLSLNQIRKEIFSKISIKKKRLKILFIGCGFGDEILFFIKNYGRNHFIYAQDLSEIMIKYSVKLLKNYNVNLNISSADSLPYKNSLFDIVFHFGGFNQFKNKKKCIFEMNRVAKSSGTVFFSDEGMAPWLANTNRFKALKINNSLWSSLPPTRILPKFSNKVEIGWILKNNFYYVKFTKKINSFSLDLDVKHKSPRGGSIRSRYENYYNKKLTK